MLVIGGVGSDDQECLSDLVRVFNLNTGTFENSYDPSNYNDYEVPSPVQSAIGGNASGGATLTAQWSDPALETLFISETFARSAPTWYPYAVVANPSGTSTSSPTPTKSTSSSSKSGTPKYVWPLVATLIAVILLVVIGCGIFLYIRRRRNNRKNGGSATNPAFYPPDIKINDQKVDPHGMYPEVSPYNTVNSTSSMGSNGYGSAYQQQQSLNGVLMEHSGYIVHELPTERAVMELDGSTEIEKKAVLANDDTISPHSHPVTEGITPDSEVSDPMSVSTPHTGRVSVFSEEETGSALGGGGMASSVVSPVTPDERWTPATHQPDEGSPAENPTEWNWWRKMSKRSKGSSRSRASSRRY